MLAYFKLHWIAIIALAISGFGFIKENYEVLEANVFLTGVESPVFINDGIVYPVTFTVVNTGNLDIALIWAVPYAISHQAGLPDKPLIKNGVVQDYKGATIEPGTLKSYVLPVVLEKEFLEEGIGIESFITQTKLPIKIKFMILGANNVLQEAKTSSIEVTFSNGMPKRFYHPIKPTKFKDVKSEKYVIDIPS